jgi:hypothetical protein
VPTNLPERVEAVAGVESSDTGSAQALDERAPKPLIVIDDKDLSSLSQRVRSQRAHFVALLAPNRGSRKGRAPKI